VAVDPGTHTIYAPYHSDGTVSVINGSTRTVTATVPVGKDPEAVAVDPGTHTVYFANSGDGTVSVIDGSTHTVTATVPVGKDPARLAVDPGTHAVYVANYGDGINVTDSLTWRRCLVGRFAGARLHRIIQTVTQTPSSKLVTSLRTAIRRMYRITRSRRYGRDLNISVG
jgi:YVTN family beta-propeller protein